MTRHYLKPGTKATIRIRYPMTVFTDKVAFRQDKVLYRDQKTGETVEVPYVHFLLCQKWGPGNYALTILVDSDTAPFEVQEMDDVTDRNGEIVQKVRHLSLRNEKTIVVHNSDLLILPPIAKAGETSPRTQVRKKGKA